MNKLVTEILQLGIFFAAIVVFLDVFLTQLPVLDWLALGVVFFFIAAMILDSTARMVPKEKRLSSSKHKEHDELQWLEDVVDRTVNKHQPEALEILAEKFRSIALARIVARTNLSKKELQELAENSPNNLLGIVKDEQIARLVAGNAPLLASASYRQIAELLSMIEDWQL